MRPAKAKDVDGYIANASEITRPILVMLRRVFQQASPKLQEAIKWNVPCYEYKGPVGGFAAYRKHVTWGLWKASLLNDPDGLIGKGILKGGKIASVADMPSTAAFTKLIRQAVALNEAGINAITPDPELPADLGAMLKKHAEASKKYADYSAACKWQYVNWINSAKRPETRANRIVKAIEMMSAGKTVK